MNDFIITLIILFTIIVGQAVQHYFYVRDVQKEKAKLVDEMSRLVKALISKNANDYVMTASIDKIAPEEKQPVDNDMVDPDTLTDDEFDKSLGITRNNPK